jgi:hypothetical protein
MAVLVCSSAAFLPGEGAYAEGRRHRTGRGTGEEEHPTLVSGEETETAAAPGEEGLAVEANLGFKVRVVQINFAANTMITNLHILTSYNTKHLITPLFLVA